MGITGTPAELVGQKVRITYRDEYYFPADAAGELLPGERVASRSHWTRQGAPDLTGLAVRHDVSPMHGGPFVTVVPFARVLTVTAVQS